MKKQSEETNQNYNSSSYKNRLHSNNKQIDSWALIGLNKPKLGTTILFSPGDSPILLRDKFP